MLSHHIFFNRHGGASSGCFDSLNAARSVGDSPDHVRENLRIIKELSGVKELITARQIHGDRIEVIESDVNSDKCVDSVDALITNRQDIGLAVKLADCQGVLLHDPVHSVVAAIHCGWRGSRDWNYRQDSKENAGCIRLGPDQSACRCQPLTGAMLR